MAKLIRVSKNVADGFKKLIELSDSTFNDIITSLNSAEPAIHPGRLAEEIVPKIKDIRAESLKDIFGAVSTLSNFKETENARVEEVIDDLLTLIRKNEVDVTLNDDKRTPILKKRLTLLLENETLSLSEKVSDAYFSHDKLFTTVEINTDIRPIITDGKSKLAVLSAIMHIEYYSDGDSHHISFGIDRDDINKLKLEIENAQNNIKVNEGIIEKAGLRELKTDKE